MFGDIEEDVLLTWMIDFQGVVARKNFLSCSAKLIALKWNWALWDAGCDFSWFCTGVYFGRNPDLEVQPGRQGCILLPCLGKAQLAGGVYPWRYWGVLLMALGRLCFLDGCPASTELQLWLRLQRTLRSPHSCLVDRPTHLLDIYLCKYTNLNTQQGNLLTHAPPPSSWIAQREHFHLYITNTKTKTNIHTQSSQPDVE